jgi:lipoprotein-anchoring transpeptidase ErfK/SrfK
MMKNPSFLRILVGLGAFGVSLGLQIPPANGRDVKTTVASLLQALTSHAAVPPAAKPAAPTRPVVRLAGYPSGTVVVKTKERRLYYLVGDSKAVSYPVGVGRPDKQWSGHSAISGKYLKPAWSPPEELKRDNPNLPHVIPSGAPNNPMGVAAMTLAGGEYAIHGTNRPNSIGGFVSYGCIRMHNADILDLFDRVAVGTPVVVE